MKKDELIFHLWRWSRKKMLVMKFVVLMVLLPVITFAIPAYSQKQIKMDVQGVSLEQVLKELQVQSGYYILYNKQDVQGVKNVSLKVDGSSVKEVLELCLRNTSLQYAIEDQTILISLKKAGVEPEKKESVIIKGVVKDSKGSVLPGVTVIIKGTSVGTATGIDGNFSLNLVKQDTATLLFSFVGMKTKEVKWTGQSELNVMLEDEMSEMDEVVVIGYGTSTKKDLTGAVASFDTRVIEESTATNVATMMQGQISGLSILAGSGAPGSPARLEIRGVPSLSGATSPLIVVDNVPMTSDFDINELNPDDIQSIDVLKGASSAAIYGSRAAAGVIMITTKAGRRNQKPVINYSFDYSMTSLVSDINTLSTDEFKMLVLEAASNSAKAAGYEDVTQWSTYKKFADPSFWGDADTPWMDYIMRDGSRQQHKVSIRGGGELFGYNASLGYTNELGQVKGTEFERYTYDVGFDTDINPWISATVKVAGTITDRLSNNGSLSIAAEARPDLEPYNEDGSYYIHSYTWYGQTYYVGNPIVEMEENTNRTEGNNIRLTGNLEFKILPELTLMTQYTYQTRKGEGYSYASSQTEEGSFNWSDQKGLGVKRHSKTTNKELEVRLSYVKSFGEKHRLSAVLASNYNEEDSESYSLAMSDFADDNVQNAIWQGTNPYQYGMLSGSASGSKLLSFVGRVEYKFMDRYLFTGTLRSDGSSRFAPAYRWGTFPSFAAAWIVSEENFMKGIDWLSFLKIRAGWGKSGNGFVGEYGWRTLYSSTDYQGMPAMVPSQIGNDELKWEATEQYDLGLDFGFLRNQRIRGSLGFYVKKTEGLLYPFTMALSTGMTSTTVNFANIENKGVEFDISAAIIQNKDWDWSFGFNIGKNKNKITGLDAEFVSSPGSTSLGNTVIQEGKSLGLIYGYETDGVFRSQEEVDYYESLNPDYMYQEKYSYRKTIPGDLKFVDQNGDGRVNRDYGNMDDKVVLGCSRPDFEGGFNTRLRWKGLTLSVQGTFSYGAQKAWLAEANQFTFSSAGTLNVLDVALKRWTPENPTSNYPCVRIDFLNTDFTDFSVHDASFLKIQNINLEYKLPESIVSKTKIFGNVSVFVSANNVCTFTSYPGPSPESYSSNTIQGAAIDSDAYPRTRTFNFGLKLTVK